MSGERSVFDGEWWWPKWSDLSTLPLPPDPQQQNLSALQAFEEDLEKDANAHGSERLQDIEDISLESYPARLLSGAQLQARSEQLSDTRAPFFYFNVLRHY